MTREFKKFLYRLNRKDYQEALATISKGISDLEGFARLCVDLEPARRKRTRGRVLNILRSLSTSIYRALRSSFLCNDSHEVSLELKAPSIDVGYDDEDEKVEHCTQFTIAMSFEIRNGATRRRFWDEIHIKTARRLTSASPPSAAPQSTPAPLNTCTQPAMPGGIHRKSRKMKGVSFMVAQKLSFITSINPSRPDVKVAMATLAQPATNVAFVDTSANEVDRTSGPLVDLCMALKKARETRPACYGHLIDKDHMDRCFQVYPGGTTANSDTWSIVTLRDVLEQKDDIQPLTSLKEKIRLALAIASSVLQLSKTPWLPEVPSSKDIHFLKRGQHLSYEHPFLLRNFPEPSQAMSSSSQTTPITIVDRNPTLFALGIMLLEIMLGSSLDGLREPSEHALVIPGDEPGVIRDSVTAHRLLEQRVALINPLYKVVVERCMGCAASQDLDEENFRREVYNRVVLELEAILGHTSLGD
jgi:hypothetical protein